MRHFVTRVHGGSLRSVTVIWWIGDEQDENGHPNRSYTRAVHRTRRMWTPIVDAGQITNETDHSARSRLGAGNESVDERD